ncbi:MAG: phage protease [Dehalococcoidales bacterium]|jgi:hypothetical protein
MKEKLETVDIEDVEILAPGTWHSSTGVTTFEDKDLDEIVKSFEEIKGNKEINYEPPVKLGHSANQKLLQEDGYPAAGWVSSLKKVGNKLLASFVGVPKKIAELIEAGAYKKVSSEIYTAYEIAGKKYGKALKAVSLLGADIPAVKTLNDIVAQYSDENGIPFETVIFEESLDKKADSIRSAFYKQLNPISEVERNNLWVQEVFDNYVIVLKGDEYYKIPYSEEAGEPVFDMAKAVKVERVYQEITQINNTEEIMEEELRKVLGLDEKADVIGAVTALKAKADSAEVKLTEGEQLKEQVVKLTEAIALKERDERVGKAISEGKILPAQKDWADGYAYKDPQGFDAFVESAPKAIELGEKGTQGNEPEEVTLTESEKKVAEQMGISTDVIIKSKKEVR